MLSTTPCSSVSTKSKRSEENEAVPSASATPLTVSLLVVVVVVVVVVSVPDPASVLSLSSVAAGTLSVAADIHFFSFLFFSWKKPNALFGLFSSLLHLKLVSATKDKKEDKTCNCAHDANV